ncbi:vesicle-associated membrane protein 5 [Fundulus diaphanus]
MEDGKSRLQQAQEEVEEVKGIMLDNMNKADERSDKLNDLEQQAEELQEKAKMFEKTTRKLKKQEMPYKKMLIALGVVAGLIVLGIIIFFTVQ